MKELISLALLDGAFDSIDSSGSITLIVLGLLGKALAIAALYLKYKKNNAKTSEEKDKIDKELELIDKINEGHVKLVKAVEESHCKNKKDDKKK